MEFDLLATGVTRAFFIIVLLVAAAFLIAAVLRGIGELLRMSWSRQAEEPKPETREQVFARGFEAGLTQGVKLGLEKGFALGQKQLELPPAQGEA